MPWPIPQPDDIASRAAAVIEGEFARVYGLRNPGAAPVQPDARSPNSLLAIDARVTGDAAFDLYLYQARMAKELMPDTAVAWLARQGSIWGVPQGQPIAASGNAVFTASAGAAVDVPAEFAMTAPGSVVYQTTASVTVPAGATASIPTVALVAGSAGNLAASVVLTPVSPLAGITSVMVDGNGLTGGQDLEAIASWRARILARIRNPSSGGSMTDWIGWAQAALPGCMANACSPGPGQVTVAIAIPDTPVTAPTTAQLVAVQAYLSDATKRKPLGITVTVIAATLTPIPWTLHLNPDTTTIRAAAVSALTLWFAADATIGGVLDISRGDAALSSADGEFSHDRIAPTADYTCLPGELAVLGAVTFQ